MELQAHSSKLRPYSWIWQRTIQAQASGQLIQDGLAKCQLEKNLQLLASNQTPKSLERLSHILAHMKPSSLSFSVTQEVEKSTQGLVCVWKLTPYHLRLAFGERC